MAGQVISLENAPGHARNAAANGTPKDNALRAALRSPFNDLLARAAVHRATAVEAGAANSIARTIMEAKNIGVIVVVQGPYQKNRIKLPNPDSRNYAMLF